MHSLNPDKRNEGSTEQPTGTLRNWRLYTAMNGNTYCSGKIYGDVMMRFADGELITTSRVIAGPLKDGTICTQYSVYKLEGKGVNDVKR